MSIVGVVLYTQPELTGITQERLHELPGVEVHAADENGRLVVTVEDQDDRIVADTMVRMHDVAGVLAVSLICHYELGSTKTLEAGEVGIRILNHQEVYSHDSDTT